MIARFGPAVPMCLTPSHVFDPMRLSLCLCLWSGWPGCLPETVPSEAACPEATAQRRSAYRSPAEPVLRAFTCPYVHAGYSHWQSPWAQVFYGHGFGNRRGFPGVNKRAPLYRDLFSS